MNAPSRCQQATRLQVDEPIGRALQHRMAFGSCSLAVIIGLSKGHGRQVIPESVCPIEVDKAT